ncbi:hypothetical protein HDG34_002007 [Paraburkholderia sp. HC6.4b]|nr:hypothetical protein [Paraburkholderia sp. HC6.4b]MBB5453066.1 hypothetical protein [Paraburkholderia sp. Kb1A]
MVVPQDLHCRSQYPEGHVALGIGHSRSHLSSWPRRS